MTIIEKIKNLTWFNAIELLQDILSVFNKKIEYLEDNSSSGGGGSSEPVSATTSGIVNNIALQELGGVDKLIHGVRFGKGENSGVANTVFGYNSQSSVGTGFNNTSFGSEALLNNTSGNDNNAFGISTLKSNTSGFFSVAIGNNALEFNTTGGQNIAIGGSSLKANIASSLNIAIGTNALLKFLGDGSSTANTCIGGSSLNELITGTSNTAIGNQALRYIQGSFNTAIGRLAGIGSSGAIAGNTGTYNTMLGYASGASITSGTQNIVIGANIGASAGGVTTGSNNLVIAQNSGVIPGITTGSGNTVIGKVTGLAAGLTNTVILSDGVGTQRFISDSTNLSTLPQQTLALINADATGKAIVTKEFTNQGITINSTNVPIGGSISITTPAQTTIAVPLAVPYTNNTITRTTVTGWTFAVTAGKTYKVEVIGTYQTAALTTGGSIGFILSSGTGTIAGIMNGEIAQTTVATGLRTTIRAIDATNTTAGSFLTTTGVGVINSPHYIGGVVTFTCVTNGVFEVQFASEVAASAAQLNTGSLLLVTAY